MLSSLSTTLHHASPSASGVTTLWWMRSYTSSRRSSKLTFNGHRSPKHKSHSTALLINSVSCSVSETVFDTLCSCLFQSTFLYSLEGLACGSEPQCSWARENELLWSSLFWMWTQIAVGAPCFKPGACFEIVHRDLAYYGPEVRPRFAPLDN